MTDMESASRTYDQLAVGDAFEAGPRTITRDDIDAFTKLSGDRTALHSDDAYARTTPLGGVVAHGALNLAAATGLAFETGVFEGTVLAVRGMDVSFDRPVRPEDEVTLRLEVQDMDPRPKADRARVLWAVALRNQHGKTVMSGNWSMLMRRQAP